MEPQKRSFLSTIRAINGNQRAAVIAEPLWAVPYYLFLPFASMYMAKIGVTDTQIGFIVSLGLALQFFWSLFSGAIIDKYGRRPTMLAFTLFSWTIPCLLWALAQNYLYFVAAIFFNSMWRVTGNCFSCVIVEDGDDAILVRLYAIFGVIALLAGFLSPAAGLMIEGMGLISALRIIYLAALFLMAAKALLLFFRSRENSVGLRRKEESRGQSLLTLALGGWPEFKAAIRMPRVLLCAIFLALTNCFSTVQATFFPLLVTGAYGMSDAAYSMLPFMKSAVMLVVYLFVAPRIRLSFVRKPLFLALILHALGLLVLLLGLKFAGGALWAVFVAAACDAFAYAILTPLSESLMAVNIENAQRARINSLIIAFVLLLSIPVGWAAGQLSAINRTLPFVLNLLLLLAEAVTAFFIARMQKENATM